MSKNRCGIMLAFATALMAVHTGYCQQQTNYDEEIKRVRKELMQVQEDREKTIAEADKDAKEFEKYRKRALARMRRVRREKDSLQQQIQVFKVKYDSLASIVDAEKSRKKQYEMLQDDFRQELITTCDKIAAYAKVFPPGIASKSVSALHLLKNDLTTKSIDNIEGINRFLQITKDMHEAGSAIQIVQGSSPIPDLRGTTYWLRIGTLFEAIVNAQGSRAALWTGYDDNGNPTWEVISDAAVAGQILKAVNVREGKALPTLVALPFDHVAVEKPDEDVEKGEE